MTLLIVAAVALALTVTTTAHPSYRTDRNPATCDTHSVTFHIHRARVLIKNAYDLEHWASGPKRSDIRAFQEHKRCLSVPTAKFALHELRLKLKAKLEAYAQYRRLTPYPGPGGTWWAIPWEIVSCESGGSWSAANPSGAIGPYQLLGHGAPWPVTGWADKLAHHRIASDLWAGGAGRSAWVC